MSKALKKRRRNLWEADPHCYWCHRELAWKETTADHINQKVKLGDERRPRHGRIVLACEKCNSQRAIDAHNEMSQIEKWMRTGNVPRLKRAWRFQHGKTSLISRLWILYYHFMFNIFSLRVISLLSCV